MQAGFALLAGLLFGVGLIVSGMANPQKVLGFLDLAGRWDPSLAFVMAGATGVAVFAFAWAKRRTRRGSACRCSCRPCGRSPCGWLPEVPCSVSAGDRRFCSARDRVDRLRVGEGDRVRRRDAGRDGGVRVGRAAQECTVMSGSPRAKQGAAIARAARRDDRCDCAAFPAGTRMEPAAGRDAARIALPDGVRLRRCSTPRWHTESGSRPARSSNSDRFDRFDGYIRRACTRVSDAAHEAAFETLGRLVREATAATYARCRPAGPANSQALRLPGHRRGPTAAISSAGRVRGEVLADQRQVTIADREIACGARPFGLTQRGRCAHAQIPAYGGRKGLRVCPSWRAARSTRASPT